MLTKIYNILALLVLLFCCTACPYESQVPIDSPQISIDETLLGKWKDAESTNKDFYELKKLDNQRYAIIENTLDETLEVYRKEEYTGYLSLVSGMLFWNLKTSKPDKGYLIYKVEFTKDKQQFTLLPLSDNIKEKFSNSQDLKAFIDKYKALSFFYGKEMNFVRIK